MGRMPATWLLPLAFTVLGAGVARTGLAGADPLGVDLGGASPEGADLSGARIEHGAFDGARTSGSDGCPAATPTEARASRPGRVPSFNATR